MGVREDSGKEGKAAAMITLTDEDLVRLMGIEMDRDAKEALAFVRECVLPQVRRQQNSRMKGVLDGGSGSLR